MSPNAAAGAKMASQMKCSWEWEGRGDCLGQLSAFAIAIHFHLT
jgi:hypothetical protein